MLFLQREKKISIFFSIKYTRKANRKRCGIAFRNEQDLINRILCISITEGISWRVRYGMISSIRGAVEKSPVECYRRSVLRRHLDAAAEEVGRVPASTPSVHYLEM